MDSILFDRDKEICIKWNHKNVMTFRSSALRSRMHFTFWHTFFLCCYRPGKYLLSINRWEFSLCFQHLTRLVRRILQGIKIAQEPALRTASLAARSHFGRDKRVAKLLAKFNTAYRIKSLIGDCVLTFSPRSCNILFTPHDQIDIWLFDLLGYPSKVEMTHIFWYI